MSTSRTISYNALLTSTREKLHKAGAVQEAVFEAIPTLSALRSKGSFRMDAKGGEVIRISINHQKNTNGKSFSGYEAANLTPQDEFTIAHEDWKQYSWTTPISGIELFKNSGDMERVFNLLKEKEKVTMYSAQEDLAADIWEAAAITSAGVMGNSGKDINSIPLIVQADPTDGKDVHGIDQSANSWWQNRAISGAGMTTYALFLRQLSHAVNTANRGRGGKRVDVGIMDQVTYELHEEALNDKVRYMSTKSATAGFETINHKGIDWMWDIYVPDAGDNSLLGTNGGPDVTLGNGSIYLLNSNCLKFYVGKDFVPTPFVDGTYNGQDAKVSMTLFYGQLVCDSRRNQAVIYNVPTAFS